MCIGRQAGKTRLLAVMALHKAFSAAKRKVLVVSAGDDAAKALLAEATVLPEDVEECGGRLTEFLRRYLPQFYRVEQGELAKVVIQGGKIETRPASSYVFTVAELTKMLADTGFEVVSLAGGFAGERYELGSPRLVLTAQRA